MKKQSNTRSSVKSARKVPGASRKGARAAAKNSRAKPKPKPKAVANKQAPKPAKPAKKPLLKKAAQARRVVKKASATKVVAKKPATQRPKVKKAAARKVVAKQPKAKKAAFKRAVAKGIPAKKAPVKTARPAAKKVSAKKPAPAKKAVATSKEAPSPAVKKVAPVKKTVVKSPVRLWAGTTVMASGVTNVASRTLLAGGTQPLRAGSPISRKTRKPRLLWIGDALVPTGFATVTHAVLNHLQRDWEVVVSGVNYDGAPHDLPYQVLPAWQGGDMWGMNRFRHLCAEFDPAVVVINNDWWNVAQFAKLAPAGVPVIGYMPVDGGGLDPKAMRQLTKLHAAVWYTDYGHQQAAKAGFKGSRHVIPHGIDTSLFHAVDRNEARRILDLNVPKNAFIVGNLNRNQPRKRLDLTIEIFADWVRRHQVSNAFLLLHCAQKDAGWDLRRIAAHHGVAHRLLLTGGEDMRDLQSSRHLHLIYASLDVQMTTTLGEGWGLTTMEGMACGIPQIVPDSSALAEWAAPAVKVPCSRTLWTPEITTAGALVDHEPFVQALDDLYRNKAARQRLGTQGIAHTCRAEFRWKRIARQFHAVAVAVMARHPHKKPRPQQPHQA